MANDRSSEADEPVLVQDAQEIARIEAENTLRQFDAAMHELQEWIGNRSYKLRASIILRFNRIALNRLSKYAGVYRPGEIKIKGSSHAPIPAEIVPEQMEEFCDYINENWHDKSPIHLSAYALWRLNWIHPFVDGNGRTSRIVSYLVICAKLGYRLPGTNTIPEQISSNKTPYYHALESADRAWANNVVDVSELEALIDAHLAVQLLNIHDMANGTKTDRYAVAETGDDRHAVDALPNKKPSPLAPLVKHVENHPVIYTGIFALLAVIVGSVLT